MPGQNSFVPFGGESLLAQTRARLESLFCVDRQMFVATRAHERYYREELRNVDDARIIPQPLNRGTGVALPWRSFIYCSGTRMPWWPSSHVITTTPTMRHSPEPSDGRSLVSSNIRIRSSSWVPGPTTRKSNTGGLSSAPPFRKRSPAVAREPVLGKTILAASTGTLTPRLPLEHICNCWTRQHLR
jgi:hypothetical protein